MYVGFRLNPTKDKDIIDALENAKDKTREIKKLLRRGINGNSQMTMIELAKPEKPIPIDWRPAFTSAEPETVSSNILAGFD